jgi:proteasome lid subunit RPN8/RPN11
MSQTLWINQQLMDQLAVHASACFPEEACGLLGGQASHGVRYIPVTNQLHSRVEFYMQPQEQLNAMMALENEGLEILAIFHSHPQGPATPSRTDLQRHYYQEAALLIASPAPDRVQMRNSSQAAVLNTSDKAEVKNASGRGELSWQISGYQIVDGKINSLQVVIDRLNLDE